MYFQQVDDAETFTCEAEKLGKESSIDDTTKHAVDLSDEEPPHVNVTQQAHQTQTRGKRRMTATNKSKEGSQGSSGPPSTSLADHKLLKTIKQEK